MKKSTLTTLLGLLFVLPFSSCEAVPSGSEASLESLESSTSESSLEDSLSTGGRLLPWTTSLGRFAHVLGSRFQEKLPKGEKSSNKIKITNPKGVFS